MASTGGFSFNWDPASVSQYGTNEDSGTALNTRATRIPHLVNEATFTFRKIGELPRTAGIGLVIRQDYAVPKPAWGPAANFTRTSNPYDSFDRPLLEGGARRAPEHPPMTAASGSMPGDNTFWSVADNLSWSAARPHVKSISISSTPSVMGPWPQSSFAGRTIFGRNDQQSPQTPITPFADCSSRNFRSRIRKPTGRNSPRGRDWAARVFRCRLPGVSGNESDASSSGWRLFLRPLFPGCCRNGSRRRPGRSKRYDRTEPFQLYAPARRLGLGRG